MWKRKKKTLWEKKQKETHSDGQEVIMYEQIKQNSNIALWHDNTKVLSLV